MSTGNFQQTSRSLPPPSSTSVSRTPTPGATNSIPKSQLDNKGLSEDIKNLPTVSSNQYNVMLPPHSQAQHGNLPQNILNAADYSFHVPYSSSRHQNLYLLSSDGTTVTSQSSLEEKERDKGAPNLVVSSRIFNNTSISHQTTIGPKPYVTLHISDSKNDKMISGFDRQVDGLSPLSVIAVSNFHEHGQSSPNLTNSGLAHSQQALRYQAGNDAMLSAINYNENDMLPEGEFDVPVTSTFGTLDGLLGSIGGGGVSASSMRLPDLLEGDGSQEPYIDTGQDLQLSPESFTTGAEGFNVDSSSLSRISNSATSECTEESRKTPEGGSVALAEKLRAKSRPVKATSPSRPGTQPCPTCGKVFSNSSALTKHKLTHSDERKYICQLCTKAFKRQDHLNGHMLTHRNKKPYECDVEGCAKSYCDARSLRRHKENHHSNTCSTGNVNIPTVGSHMNVIPAMTPLGFASIQSSFPASVITSSSDHIFSDGTENCNRIQYAPAIGTANQSLSHSEFNQDSASKSAERQIISSVAPTAASKLQFLALHQQPQQFHQQNKAKTTQAPSSRTEKHTVLAPWHPQTINTSALLLAQNFGSLSTSQSSISQSQTSQIDISKTLDTISNIKNRSSPSSLTQHLEAQASEDLKKESHSHESQKQTLQSSDSDSYLSSPVGPTTSHSSTEVPVSFSHTQLSSDHGLDIDTSANSTDNMFGQHPVSLNATLQQTTASGSDSTSVDTSVTTSMSNIVAISESDQPQINSPLLQQLLTPPQRMDVLSNSTTEGALAQRAALLQQALLAGTQQQSLHQQSIFPNWNQVAISFTNSSCNNSRFGPDPKPVACSICKRKFKNIPALNGHMRLHGGYFKKENDLKKTDRKQLVTSQQQPLQTASTNVRALIEEKIIKKIATSQANSHLGLDTLPLGGNFYTQTDLPVIEKASTASNAQFLSSSVHHSALSASQENTLCNDFTPTSQNSTLYDNISKINNELMAALDWQKEINELKEQFRVPQPPGEKLRRHSDSDHFIPSKRQCPSYTKSALADLLKKKVAKRTSRTGSDPGEPLLHAESSQTSLTSPVSNAPSHTPPDLTPHIPFSTGHPLSVVSNQTLSSLNVEDSDLPSLLEQELIKSSESDVCLAMSSSVFSSVTQALSTTVCPIANGNELDKRDELSSTATDSSQWSTNLTLQFFGNESQPHHNTVIPSLPPSSAASGSTSNCPRNKTGEDSNDDDVFLSPVSLPTSPLKIKRKHRPEPLFIPPYVNNCGFTSRLRSPRLWDPSNPDNKNASPPPYTPPPMLSPVRSGSGLFWHILSGSGSLTPKSAPITPSFSLIRRNSTSEVSPEEEEICEAPETDIQPHVNIGSNFQARLPPFNPNRHEALRCEEKADIVWDPKIAENLSENDVEMYLDLSCSAVVPGGGKNKEYAMHVLHLAGGNIQEAMLRLMDPNPLLPIGHPLLTYKYPETDKWTPEDIESYHQSLIRCDKDFYSISQEMQMKTVKQCVQFYYIWKKVCPEEYKRLRLIRRRREQESLIYGSRPQLPSDCDEKVETVQDGLDCDAHFPDINMPTANGSIPTSEQNPAQNTIDSTHTSASRTINGSSFLPIVRSCDMSLDPPEEFPCKICGKVFSKVKSRSAHMKSHKQTESEKKNKFDC